jgi:hypothetical protein
MLCSRVWTSSAALKAHARRRQCANIAQFVRHLKLKALAFATIGDADTSDSDWRRQPTLQAGESLRAKGLWVAAIRPPTVAKDTARLRITLSAAHESAQIARWPQRSIPGTWRSYEFEFRLFRHGHRYWCGQDLDICGAFAWTFDKPD